MTGQRVLHLVNLLFLDVQKLLYPVHPPHPANVIIEHGTKHIAHCGIDDERLALQTRREQSYHDGLTAERYEAAGKKGGNEHAPVTVVDEYLV